MFRQRWKRIFVQLLQNMRNISSRNVTWRKNVLKHTGKSPIKQAVLILLSWKLLKIFHQPVSVKMKAWKAQIILTQIIIRQWIPVGFIHRQHKWMAVCVLGSENTDWTLEILSCHLTRCRLSLHIQSTTITVTNCIPRHHPNLFTQCLTFQNVSVKFPQWSLNSLVLMKKTYNTGQTI